MKNKRGLSQVVTTVILILLIIMAIAGIWVVVDRVILEGTSRINLEQFTIDLKIVSAKINYSSGIAEVRVKRNQGEGNLTAIKFIVEDPRTSEVFEEKFIRFEELAEKTFYLDLIVQGTDLIIFEIDKISIAPVYVAGAGTSESLGGISDSISGIKDLNITGLREEENGTGSQEMCIENSNCGTDILIEGYTTCNDLGDQVLQFMKIFTCEGGWCFEDNVLVPVESCPSNYICYDGACIEQQITCTNETILEKCGYDDWVGSLSCQTNPEAITQNFRTYTCPDEFCESNIGVLVKEYCLELEICFDGECFEPLECTQNSDCDFGEVCKEGVCEIELVIDSGTIYSAWPFRIAEYFDSLDLPQDSTTVSAGQYVVFPGSNQTTCLKIEEFYAPDFEGGISYVKLETSPTNISNGDNYEIWETNYICSLY